MSPALRSAVVAFWRARRSDGQTVWPAWIMPGPRLRWREWLAVCLAAAVATVLMTWPVPMHMAAGVITTPERVVNPDLGQNVWNIWHYLATWSRTDVLWSQLVAAPLSVNLVAQSYGIANLVLVAPLAALAGPVVAANAIILFGFWAGIVLMTVAALRMCHSLPLAFVVGCVFVLSPAHLKNIEWAADENAAVHWIVLLFLTTTWWLRRPLSRRALALAAVLLLITLASGYYGLFGVVFVAGLSLAALWSVREVRWVVQVLVAGMCVLAGWSVVMLLLTGDVLDPQRLAGVTWTAPVSAVGSTGLRDWQMRQTVWLHVVSLADLITPLPNHPLWGRWGVVAARGFPSEMGGYLGLVVLAVAIWTAIRQRQHRPLLAVAGMCLLLAGGLELKLWYDQPFPALPGPLWLLDVAGVFRNATRPGLFLLFAGIPLLLVVAAGIAQLPVGWPRLLVCLLLLLDAAPPQWVVAPLRTSAAARVVPADAGAVLTLPIEKNDDGPLLDQVCHGQPIVAGYLARTPTYPVALDPRTIAPELAALRVLPQDGFRMLQNIGVGTIIARDPETAASLQSRAAAGLTRIAIADAATVYTLAPATLPVALAGSGWWEPEGTGTTQWRWTQDEAEVVLVSNQARRISLAVAVSALTEIVSTWSLDGRTIARISVPAQPAALERVLTLVIPAGRSVLRLDAPATTDSHGRPVALAFTTFAVRGAQPITEGARVTVPVPSYRYCVPPRDTQP